MTEQPQEQDVQLEMSVVNRVMTSFVDAVGDEPGLSEIAARLRKIIVKDGSLSEMSLRDAMFGDAEA